MTNIAHFSVATRLTRLLGETYRSSEAALKELVDNAWDADANNVWITLPAPLTNDAIIVQDDGSGMTGHELRSEYLNIASDKRARTGERTPKFNRRVKGRKGIGKFSGLMIAGHMAIEAVARGRQCKILIDKKSLIENPNDLEAVPLPFSDEPLVGAATGTKIVLSSLDQSLNFPNPDRLRELLIHEYGREDGFRVFVNNVQLSIEDVPGQSSHASAELPDAGLVNLRFTVADGRKIPKFPGIILRVDGKTVGRPVLFGLDEDDEIPQKLAKRVYGEVELTGLEDAVTADWGAIIENSKAYIEVKEYVVKTIKEVLRSVHYREMNLQKARIEKKVRQRLQDIPEFRRKYAQEAVERILNKFYGESDERVVTVVEVALDAMEHDVYWAIIDQIAASSHGDVSNFAASLEQFGLIELSTIAIQANRRLQFLDYLDELIRKPETLEKDIHQAIENSLWVFGRKYSLMSSNITLRKIIESYCGSSFKGSRASKRPDLLLSQDYGDRYLLVEFKRAFHSITRDDIAQAEKYRDDLSSKLSSKARMEIITAGKGRVDTIDINRLADGIFIESYESIISSARNDLEWLVRSLSH